jgi:hypothetical protein
MFPKQVVQTALSLAQLHSLTEDLDMAMAQCWLNSSHTKDNNLIANYVAVWREVGRRSDRDLQLSGALAVGKELVKLTSTPGLRLALKMMRKPASLAGMADLQHFLESGFDTFAAMEQEENSVNYFLNAVEVREKKLFSKLYASSHTVAQDAITDIMKYAT